MGRLSRVYCYMKYFLKKFWCCLQLNSGCESIWLRASQEDLRKHLSLKGQSWIRTFEWRDLLQWDDGGDPSATFQTLRISPKQRLRQILPFHTASGFKIKNVNFWLYDLIIKSPRQPRALTPPPLSAWVIQGSLFAFVLSLIPRGLDT